MPELVARLVHHLSLVPRIERAILLVRGQKIMLDSDLATLYGVPTKALMQAVKRNLGEAESLRPQIVTLNRRRGKHRKYLPYAFTQEGIANSAR